ncbi:sodium/hydrogen exchanger 6 [Tanacetum coccineum]
MIRNSPIILKKWTMNTSLHKEELTCILIWVKLHDVPIQVFEEDGISLIATYLGKPIMLDSYTSSMCIPDLDGPGHTKETIRKVMNRKRNNKGSSAGNKLPKGVLVSKGFQAGKDFAFKPKASNVGSNGDNGTRVETNPRAGPSNNINEGVSLNTMGTNARQQDTGKKTTIIASPNPFAALGVDKEEEEEVENIWDESKNLNLRTTGASTPAQTVFDVYVCAILESHVDVAAIYDTCKKVCSRWKWTSNGSLCSKGSRIILGWNDDLVDVMIMAQTNQVMHVQVNTRVDHKTLFCSFVYADNNYIDRRVLWSNLVGHVGLMRNRPWVLLGDFNAALNLEDHSAGGYEPNAAMREFKKCVQAMEVADVNSTGLHFTWNQKPKGSNGIIKKIDMIMEGCTMFRVVKRLKGLKSPFRKLLYNHGNLHERLDEERFLKQKAKIEWLKADDSNTAYFHKIVKSKCTRNRIKMVSDASNNLYDGNQVPDAFVNHYNQFLGAEGVTIPLDDHDLFTRVLDDAKADFMVREVSNDEVKSVIFSMGDDRAPGPDGFTAAFFKKAWDVVGGDITCAVQDFFSNGKLLKELNHTIISLIPKVTTPACINDYRPISCCNVLYKCISKIIANKVKEGLGDIVSINQSAYVPGDMVLVDVHSKLIFNRPMILWIGVFLRLFLWVLAFTPRWSNGLWFVLLGPLTLYVLMVTCMVGLKRRVRDSDDFKYHHLCEQQRIINLCFANDLFLFSRSNPSSVAVIMDALEEFKQVLGLVPSIPKSTAFFCNVPNAIKASILNSMPFAEGVLPVRYLGEMKKGKAKVAWDSVCMPKHEGGLGHSFWDVPCRGDFSWGWRKLLQIRSTTRPFIWHNINSGKSTSAWFDRWADLCPLKDMFSNRDIARSGFSLDDSVNNLISDGVWRWPLDWLSRFPIMAQLQVPLLLDDIDDVILWRNKDGVLRPFSVACAWDTIRARADIVNWYNVVWFPHCIPRHAIHMWLVFQQKLKTQDRLQQWDVGLSIDLNLLRCPLYDLVPDSHGHLFFECAFSSQVWSKVRVLCSMDSIPPRFIDVTTFINPISKGKTAVSILSRLVLAATSHYIWLERNGRLFKKKTSTSDQIVDVIISMVRLKLVTFKFKKMSIRSRLLLDQWKIPM